MNAAPLAMGEALVHLRAYYAHRRELGLIHEPIAPDDAKGVALRARAADAIAADIGDRPVQKTLCLFDVIVDGVDVHDLDGLTAAVEARRAPS